ncbi:MAG: glycosyl hydrolase family 18 protein [Candidatus Acidiferrales bacterium]|jgi:spore germination protein YaaH
MKTALSLLALLFSVSFSAAAQQPKSLFYMTRDPNSVRSFLAHADKIDTLVPTWYVVDSSGLVSGGPNPMVMETARQHHVPVMPIVANAAFVQDDFHKLLVNPSAYRQMFAQLVHACKDFGYIGFQFDFENIHWTDRDALSTMVGEAASLFHEQRLELTIATVPNAPGAAGETGYTAWIYENWRGAYDLAALAKGVDLICLMTYDQHTRWTPPGPVAGWSWTVSNVEYALKFVPREKLSLGIPLYGYHWFAGTPVKLVDKPNPSAEYISTSDALDLGRAYGGQIEWDAADRAPWFYFYRDGVREWIFYTDVRAFRERYTLAKERGLQGFCSWVLGTEDPGIWDLLPSHP